MSDSPLSLTVSEDSASNTQGPWRQWRNLHRDADTRLSEIYSNRAPLAALPAAQQQKMKAVYATVNQDANVSAAWQRLLNYLGRNSPFVSVEPMVAYLGTQPGNTLVDALLMLALRHEQWQNAPEAYLLHDGNPRRQFAGLLRHLFARYDVPAFMDAAWFEGFTPHARQRQDWFLHIGQGHNIRRAELPLRLTEKAAHYFLLAPCDGSIVGALRWGQTLALGGSEYLAQAITDSRLGKILPDEPFWESVIHWFVNQSQAHSSRANPSQCTASPLDLAHVGPIVDYLWEHRFGEPTRHGLDGSLSYDAAPEPGLSMKGRTRQALLKRVDEWHAQLAKDARRTRAEWKPCGVMPFYIQTRDMHKTLNTWTIVELCSSKALQEEGREMRHCVFTYANCCLNGTTAIWSLRVRPERDVKTRRLLTIEINLARRAIVQVRGHCNKTPGSYSGNGRMRTASEMLRQWAREQKLSVACSV